MALTPILVSIHRSLPRTKAYCSEATKIAMTSSSVKCNPVKDLTSTSFHTIRVWHQTRNKLRRRT